MDKTHPLIKVGSKDFRRYYQICISDNGFGIPKDKLSKIFQQFEVAHDKQTVDSHGIGISSEKDG